MSREVRRVPVGWKHPLEYNPHWEFQASTPWGRSRPVSWLHGPEERFVPLYGESYTPAHEKWERERVEWEAGRHERESAEAVVRSGWAPSAMIIGNTFYKGDEDADKIEALTKDQP